MPHLDTILAQAGSGWDTRTGAISMPVYHSATFRHPALGQSTGFDYSRTANPTRQVLEELLAKADSAARGFAFSSGLAAIDAVIRLFQPGDTILATEDLYGGTFRLFEKLFPVFRHAQCRATVAFCSALLLQKPLCNRFLADFCPHSFQVRY